MDLAAPHEAVAPSLSGGVVVTLWRAAEPLSGRAVAARVGASHEAVRRHLVRLDEHGLVTSRPAGRAVLYELNRDHVLAPAVEVLARARRALFGRMTELISTWEPAPLSVTVYGSAARGEGGVGSDIDVLVIRSDDTPEGFSHWDEHLPDLADAIRRWSGNAPEIVEYSRDDLAGGLRRGEGLARSAAHEGRHVFGEELRRLAVDVRRGA